MPDSFWTGGGLLVSGATEIGELPAQVDGKFNVVSKIYTVFIVIAHGKCPRRFQ